VSLLLYRTLYTRIQLNSLLREGICPSFIHQNCWFYGRTDLFTISAFISNLEQQRVVTNSYIATNAFLIECGFCEWIVCIILKGFMVEISRLYLTIIFRVKIGLAAVCVIDMMTIFIYCIWVRTRWLRSVILYKNRKETAIYKRRNNTLNNTKTQNRQSRKQI
jgi:hypothetical protein